LEFVIYKIYPLILPENKEIENYLNGRKMNNLSIFVETKKVFK
jgi:hypothetical protein